MEHQFDGEETYTLLPFRIYKMNYMFDISEINKCICIEYKEKRNKNEKQTKQNKTKTILNELYVM